LLEKFKNISSAPAELFFHRNWWQLDFCSLGNAVRDALLGAGLKAALKWIL